MEACLLQIKWSFDELTSTLLTGENFSNITLPYYHNYSNIGLPIFIEEGWNFISIPLRTSNMAVTNLFPNAISQAFTYINGVFESVDTLEEGKGYWINFNHQSVTEIVGSFNTNLITVNEGWNAIGSFHYNVPTNDIYSNPANIIASPFFGMQNTGYLSANYLEIAKGYWVKVNEEGHLLFNSSN